MCGTWGYRAGPAVSGQGQCLQPSVFTPSLATRLTTIWGCRGWEWEALEDKDRTPSTGGHAYLALSI